MNSEYSRPTINPSEGVRSSLPAYYLERPSHLGISRPPFESIQMLDNFVNKKKRPDPSSHKSMQFPPNTKFLTSNNPPPEPKKVSTTHQDKKNIRSVSRPKSGENLQSSKSLYQSRSSNSLSAAKNTPEPVQQVPKAKQQTLSPHVEKSAQPRYPVPKGKQDHVRHVSSIIHEREEVRLRKPVSTNKQNIRNLHMNQGLRQHSESYFYNDAPSIPREDQGSITFPRFTRNFSHNNSVHQDYSHFQLTMHEDPSSSEFNFESPIPTNRAAQDEEFIKFGHNRFSPMTKRQEPTPKDTQSPPVKKNKLFYNVEIDKRLEREAEKTEHEGNSVVITKGSMDLSQSRVLGKTLGLENLSKLPYESDVFQGTGYSPFNVPVDVSTKATNPTNPTYRGKPNQSHMLGDSIEHQNVSQSNYDMLGTSHFNSNLVFGQPEKDENIMFKMPDNVKHSKDQYKLLTEFSAKHEDKPLQMQQQKVSASQQLAHQDKKVISKPVTKTKTNSVQMSKVSPISSHAAGLNKSPQPQMKKISPKNRPITEPNTEFFQPKYLGAVSQLKKDTVQNKIDKTFDGGQQQQQDIKKLKIFPVNRKKDNQSITPNPTSRNARTKSDIQSAVLTKSQEKPKYLNIDKVRNSKIFQKVPTTSEYSPSDPLDNSSHVVRGTIGERIRNQALLNADRDRLDKFHMKSQSVVFQELHNKSFQAAGTTSNDLINRKVPTSHNQSQEYYGDFPMQMREENVKKSVAAPAKKETKQQQIQREILEEVEAFNQGAVVQQKKGAWEPPSCIAGIVEPPESGYSEASDSRIFSSHSRSKNIFDISVHRQDDSISQVLNEPSFRGAKGLNELLQGAGSREFSSSSRRDIRKEQQSLYRNSMSRDKGSTSRSHIERQLGSSAIEGRDDREESMINRGERFLSAFDMQMSVDISERKMSSIQREKQQSPNRALRASLENLHEFKQIASWGGHRNTVSAIVKSSSRNMVWSASRDNTIREWAIKDFIMGLNMRSSDTEREVSKQVMKDKKGIECMMCNDADGLLFSGGSDHEIKIWNSSTWELNRKLKGHKGGVFGLANVGRNALLSCSGDQTIKKWDIHTGSCVQTWNEHNNRVTSVLYDRAKFAHSFLSCSVDGKIKVWDIRVAESIATFTDHELDVTSLAYIGTQCHFASGSLDKTVRIWDLNMRTMVDKVDVESPVYNIAHYAKTDKIIVGANQLKAICLGEDEFKVETIEDGASGSTRSLMIDNELDLLYTGSVDCLVKVWFLDKGRPDQLY